MTSTLSARAWSWSSVVEPTNLTSMLVLFADAGRVTSTELVPGLVVLLFERSCVLSVSHVPDAEVFHWTIRSPSSELSLSVSWPQV